MASPDSGWTVYSSIINSALQTAKGLGADTEELLNIVDLDSEALNDPDNRFPVGSLLKLYELASERTDCPDIGIYTGRVAYVNGLHLQLYMSTICSTFREYLNLMPSVLRFAGDLGEVIIRSEGSYIRLEWTPLWPETSKQRFLSDELLTMSAAIVNSLCIRPIPVIKAHFTYTEPDDLSVLQSTFGDDLHFSQPVSCLYFERASLDYTLTQLDAEISATMSQPMQRLFDKQAPEDAFITDLRDAVLRLLPAGEMNIDKAASELNVSRRTLQRRLSERGTHFLQVLQNIRADLALRYLADSRLGITDIAFLLGYADQGSFSNVFKSWHGISPREYRQR